MENQSQSGYKISGAFIGGWWLFDFCFQKIKFIYSIKKKIRRKMNYKNII